MSNPPVEPSITPRPSSEPWHAQYTPPRTTAEPITREEIRKLIESDREGQRHVLVDLRRSDHEGGTIRGSINLPAQSLYSSIPTLYRLFSSARVRQVIWYCGSSAGRGTRAAAWFADYIAARGHAEMQSLVLLEGIKGWVAAGSDYVALMDDYNSQAWQQ